jgi:hypothetical protein
MSAELSILLLLGLTVACAGTIHVLRRPARQSVPLADALSLRPEAWRTTLLRGACALLLTALAAASLLVLPHGSEASSTTPRRTYATTIVVLDVSSSITRRNYSTIVRTLDAVARGGAGRRAGLILFSDTAQEALPPETPASEVRAFSRYFIPLPGQSAAIGGGIQYPSNPWFERFTGGTAISSGLALARRVAHADHVPHARVLLASDLADDASDSAALDRELHVYAKDPLLDLRVVPLPSSAPSDVARFSAVLGRSVVAAGPGPGLLVAPGSSGGLSLPTPFLVLVAALALALVLNEIAAAALSWGPPPRPSGADR